MLAPRWLQKDLALINPLYFAVWDNLKNTWRIRKWNSIHPVNQKLLNWQFASVNIMTVTDDLLDMRVIHALREGFYWARHHKEIIQEVDEANERLERSHELETELLSRELAKSIWKYYREPTVDYGQRGVR